MQTHNMRRFFGVLTVLLLCSGLSLLVVALLPEPRARVTVFDVGQGDAILLESSDRRQMLIDGGPGNAVLEKLGRALPFWDRSLDAVLLTHPDADHSTGLIAVVRRYRVKEIIMTGVQHETTTYELLQREIAVRRIPTRSVRAGDRVALGAATFVVGGPVESRAGRTTASTNGTSIIGRFLYRNFSVLLPGDASNRAERAAAPSVSDVDILKVGHHGSRTSTTPELLNAARPELAVISVGAGNPYGHPHEATLERLAARGIPVLRTDERGDITINSDGDTERVSFGLWFRLW